MTNPAAGPRLILERAMHRQTIAVPGETMASYALLRVIPLNVRQAAARLHIALAIDVSSSMYAEDGTGVNRLARVRSAVVDGLGRLRPEDRIAIVAFAAGAKVVLPLTRVAEIERVQVALDRIDLAEVDPNGTTLDEGLRLALGELADPKGPRVARVVALTDGATTGQDACRDLARSAGAHGVPIDCMGFGAEWDLRLLPELALLSGGRWHYLNAEEGESARTAFNDEFDALTGAGFARAELLLRTVRDVRIKNVRRVGPDIQSLRLVTGSERNWSVELGMLQRSRPAMFLVDLSLPKRPDGKYVVVQAEVKGELGDGRSETTGPQTLDIEYHGGGHGYVNPDVARQIDHVQFFELAARLDDAIGRGDSTEGCRIATQLARKGEVLGPRAARKMMLAKRIADELVAGQPTRLTRIALMDSARFGDELSPSERREQRADETRSSEP